MIPPWRPWSHYVVCGFLCCRNLFSLDNTRMYPARLLHSLIEFLVLYLYTVFRGCFICEYFPFWLWAVSFMILCNTNEGGFVSFLDFLHVGVGFNYSFLCCMLSVVFDSLFFTAKSLIFVCFGGCVLALIIIWCRLFYVCLIDVGFNHNYCFRINHLPWNVEYNL